MPVSTFAQCTGYNQGAVLETAIQCNNQNGVIIKVGFFIDPLIELYRVCYNSQKTSPIYSIHYIHGKSKAMIGKRPSNWKKDGTARDPLDLDGAYSRPNQVRRLDVIFGPNHMFREPLERGHLAAYADFSMQSWRHASNFYINAFPQWKSINNGNWKVVEDKVREHASNAEETFKVITGTYDILMLGGGGGRQIDLYAGEGRGQNRVPVPKFSWKILYDEFNRQAIGFVTLNNPYINPDVIVEFPCMQNGNHQPISMNCAEWGWDFFHNTPTRGYTICCAIPNMLIPVVGQELFPDFTGGILRKREA